jgi:hypothetical protein
MTSADDYLAKAAEALAQHSEAKTDAERTRLTRARGAYMKLARHGEEAAERAAKPLPRKIKPEKPAETKADTMFRRS